MTSGMGGAAADNENDRHASARNAVNVNLKAIESKKFAGKHYIFEKQLGKGVQAAVWLFKLDEQHYAGKITS